MSGNNRIAFLCHPYHRGGVTRWMADVAMAFAHIGWEVYFVTVEPSVVFFSGKGRETLLQLLQKGNAPVHTISALAGREFEFGTKEYRAYVYRQQLMKLPKGTPVILSDDETVWQAAAFLHNVYPVIGVLHADETYYYALARKYFQQVSVLICVSERVKKITLECIPGINAETVYTIPCGINLPINKLNPHFGNVLQLVYVGRISEYQKRTGDLVKLCALLHQKNSVFHLNIIGDGPDKATLANKFIEAGLTSLVTFHGWLLQSEVSKWLSDSDILVLTSDFEGTPIAMMEGLAAGCGLVGTRVSGIEDYELHPLSPDCIALFNVGDMEDAVSKIMKLASVSVSARQQAARKLAECEFSMEVCLKRYINAIEAIQAGSSDVVIEVSIPVGVMIRSRMVAWARYLKVAVANRKGG